MNKLAVVGGIVVLVALAGGGVLLANHNSTKNKTTDTSMNMNTKAPTPNNTSTASNTNSVTIENFAFSPSAITVKKGTTVTWTNKDSATHTVTETDGQNGPKSGDLATGKSFVFTFDKVGTYKYDCSIHPNMTGTVTVTE